MDNNDLDNDQMDNQLMEILKEPTLEMGSTNVKQRFSQFQAQTKQQRKKKKKKLDGDNMELADLSKTTNNNR